jgi:alpha-galactosidase
MMIFLNLILLFLTLIHAKREEAGRGTPQLGWNSWNKFGCDISEKLIKDIVDALSSTGLRDAGYEYVNIDDCWQATSRDESGKLMADPQRFPSGMKALGTLFFYVLNCDYCNTFGII